MVRRPRTRWPNRRPLPSRENPASRILPALRTTPLWVVDLFNALCGAQLGLFIHYRKVERGFDTFNSQRLLLLALATALTLVLLARFHSALVALLTGHEAGKVSRVDAATNAPLIALALYPLLATLSGSHSPVTFKTAAVVSVGSVLALKVVTAARWLRPPEQRAAASLPRALIFLLAAAAALLPLLRFHHDSLGRATYGPHEGSFVRAVAVDRGTYRESFQSTTAYFDDSLRHKVEVPEGARLVVEIRPPSHPDGPSAEPVLVTMTVSREGSWDRVAFNRLVAAGDDHWSELGDFVNHGPEGSFQISLKCTRPVTGALQETLALLSWALPPRALRPWLPIERHAALVLLRPRVEIPRPPDLPNVIYISIDMVRADHLGLYGYNRDTAPYLGQLAADGVLFERAYSTDTWTIPAHMTALSSLYTSAHQINDFETTIDSIEFPTVQQLLRSRHYTTAAFTDGHAVSGRYGFDLGFDVFYEEVGVIRNSDLQNMSARTFDKTQEWLERHSKVPFFLFIHTYEVHHFPLTIAEHVATYSDPTYDGFFKIRAGEDRNFVDRIHQAASDDDLVDEQDVKYAVDLYDGGIRVADRELGRFLARLAEMDLYDDTLIIVSSDHGESFRNMHDNGRTLYWYHYQPPFIEQIRIPLIIKFPARLDLHGVVEAPVSLIDLAPTILDVVGSPPPGTFQGNSLLPLVRGQQPGVGHPIIAERVPSARNVDSGSCITVTDGQTKYVLFSSSSGKLKAEQFYDLRADPLEQWNLARDATFKREDWEPLVAEAESHVGSFQSDRETGVDRQRRGVDPEHMRQLRALGYLR